MSPRPTSALPTWLQRVIGGAVFAIGIALGGFTDKWLFATGLCIVGIVFVLAPDDVLQRVLRRIADLTHEHVRDEAPPVEPAGPPRLQPDAEAAAYGAQLAEFVERHADERGWTYHGPRPRAAGGPGWFICVQHGRARLAIEPVHFARLADAREPDLASYDSRVREHEFANAALLVSNYTPPGVDVRATDRSAPGACTTWRYWRPGNENSDRALGHVLDDAVRVAAARAERSA